MLCQIGRHAAGRRVAEGQRAGTGLDQQAVGNGRGNSPRILISTSRPVLTARQADGAHHCRFGAG